ncbi:MAG: methylmalonyl Co-A mutase-associated GTPase MeaB [Acidobacteria bacterium]|nr:methylmalonyl Co-A mutase-associated GTPase MeaB [Acidobacteriota bacterium]
MPESLQAWAEKILAGDRRAISRAISAVENGEAVGIALLKRLFARAGNAYVIGITGSPGVGKSTLVEKLAGEYRREGRVVGILAVDPTSPFTGGAILGDRIRMQTLSNDDGVYIRSMATRGHLGGLAAAAQDAVTILDAAGCQVILVETVGVGQDEVEIARHAEATVLLLVPGMGDDVQTFKAGVMEIADVFAINKADRPGADRVEQELTAMLSLAARAEGWRPPIVKTVATSGEGVGALREALEEFRAFGGQKDFKRQREKDQWRMRLLELLRQRLYERAADRLQAGALERHVEDILARRRDPHTVVEGIISDFAPARAPKPKGKR